MEGWEKTARRRTSCADTTLCSQQHTSKRNHIKRMKNVQRGIINCHKFLRNNSHMWQRGEGAHKQRWVTSNEFIVNTLYKKEAERKNSSHTWRSSQSPINNLWTVFFFFFKFPTLLSLFIYLSSYSNSSTALPRGTTVQGQVVFSMTASCVKVNKQGMVHIS